jgi:cytochrome c6
MKTSSMAVILFFIVCSLLSLTALNGVGAAEKTGEQLFKEHCAMCHPDGGNIISPKKTLQKKVLATNNIKTADDIIKLMRKPGPGMTAFDMKSVSDREARKISDYIFKSFNK